MTWTVLTALLSHWRRNGVQFFALISGLALATALWSGVQAINAEARASYDAAAATLGEGQFDQLRPRTGDVIDQSNYIALRRAGWQVRFMPRLTGSYEETPGTLIDYVLRDRRWCRGNLQHLRLLGTRGLHPVSRFHLFHGAMAYLLSPAWFVLLVFWALLGVDAETNVIRYFNEANPLFPDWPPAMSHIDSAVFLAIMYAMLLMPKLTAALAIALSPKAARLYGGKGAFLGAVLTEILLSVAYAPVMMIQQTGAVLRALTGRNAGWNPQRRGGRAYPLRTLLAFHWAETVLGLILLAGLLSGLVSLWLLSIVISLTCAIPLSALSSLPLSEGLPGALRMQSPQTLREPAIVARARVARLRLAMELDSLRR